MSLYTFLPGLNCVCDYYLALWKREHFVHEHQLFTCLYIYYFDSYCHYLWCFDGVDWLVSQLICSVISFIVYNSNQGLR